MPVDEPIPSEAPGDELPRGGRTRAAAPFTAALVSSFAALVVGCGSGSPVVRAAERPAEPPAAAPSSVPAEHAPTAPKGERAPTNDDGTATILVSNSTETFCDGSKMDSAGYRKTLTKEEQVPLPANDGTPAGKAKAVAVAAGGLCSGALKQVDFTVRDGVVRIAPIPGWAGIGIAMCTCKPEVEVNLLRLPGISKVVWEEPQP